MEQNSKKQRVLLELDRDQWAHFSGWCDENCVNRTSAMRSLVAGFNLASEAQRRQMLHSKPTRRPGGAVGIAASAAGQKLSTP